MSKQNLATSTIFLLKYHHLYPEELSLRYYVESAFFLIFFQFLLVGSLSHLITFTLKNGPQLEVILNDAAWIVAVSATFHVQFCYLRNLRKVKYMVEVMGNFTHYQKPRTIDEIDSIMNRISKGFFLYYFLAAWILIYSLFIEKCEEGVESNCGLLMVTTMPFDAYSTPGRQISLILQLSSGFGTAMVSFFISLLILNFSEYLIAYLKELKCMLTEIPKIEKGPLRRQHLRKCVEYHQHIIELGNDLEELAGSIFILHVTATPVIISMIGFQLLMFDFDIVCLAHATAWIWASLTACVFGERLLFESQSVADAAYLSVPFDGDKETASDLRFVIMRCRNPIKLPSGKFGICSHGLFVAILKSAYSFLTLFSKSMDAKVEDD